MGNFYVRRPPPVEGIINPPPWWRWKVFICMLGGNNTVPSEQTTFLNYCSDAKVGTLFETTKHFAINFRFSVQIASIRE